MPIMPPHYNSQPMTGSSSQLCYRGGATCRCSLLQPLLFYPQQAQVQKYMCKSRCAKVKFRCNHSFLLGERVSHSYFRFQAPPRKLRHVFHFYTHFWECICGMKWGCHTSSSHRSSPKTSGSLGVAETTVRFINLLEGPTELRKAVILMVTVYYSRRTQTRISKGKRCMDRARGRQAAAPSCPILAEPCAAARFSSHGAWQHA